MSCQARCILIGGSLLLATGCGGGPTRVAPPDVDPQSAAAHACQLYDKNQDGALDAPELASCPGVLIKLKEYDQNGDGVVQREELESRLSELLRHRVGLTQLKCIVNYQGRPLADARVVFEPEPYLGAEVQPAEGTTDADGGTQLGIPEEFVPEDLRRVRVVHYGTFKVRITHPKVQLPAKYNTATELGYETEAGNPFAVFELNKG